jgi:hypothetical protein
MNYAVLFYLTLLLWGVSVLTLGGKYEVKDREKKILIVNVVSFVMCLVLIFLEGSARHLFKLK